MVSGGTADEDATIRTMSPPLQLGEGYQFCSVPPPSNCSRFGWASTREIAIVRIPQLRWNLRSNLRGARAPYLGLNWTPRRTSAVRFWRTAWRLCANQTVAHSPISACGGKGGGISPFLSGIMPRNILDPSPAGELRGARGSSQSFVFWEFGRSLLREFSARR